MDVLEVVDAVRQQLVERRGDVRRADDLAIRSGGLLLRPRHQAGHELDHVGVVGVLQRDDQLPLPREGEQRVVRLHVLPEDRGRLGRRDLVVGAVRGELALDDLIEQRSRRAKSAGHRVERRRLRLDRRNDARPGVADPFVVELGRALQAGPLVGDREHREHDQVEGLAEDVDRRGLQRQQVQPGEEHVLLGGEDGPQRVRDRRVLVEAQRRDAVVGLRVREADDDLAVSLLLRHELAEHRLEVRHIDPSRAGGGGAVAGRAPQTEQELLLQLGPGLAGAVVERCPVEEVLEAARGRMALRVPVRLELAQRLERRCVRRLDGGVARCSSSGLAPVVAISAPDHERTEERQHGHPWPRDGAVVANHRGSTFGEGS